MDNYFVKEGTTEFNILLKALPTKGHIAWEYNPFRNYRLDEDLYEYDGYYYNLAQLIEKFNIYPKCKITATYQKINENTKNFEDISININGDYKQKLTYTITDEEPDELTKWLIIKAHESGLNYNKNTLLTAIKNEKIKTWKNNNNKTDPLLRETGELVDFITDELDFNINHPIDILPQNSYDDSVNLILNDGYSYPKLINSRFSPRGRNTYEIVDRKGNADTNIYDRGLQFKTDTSLYKIINSFPKLKLSNISEGGALKVGNYFFYFRLSDSDSNETDFFEESGLVSIFKGGYSHQSTSTGVVDENSFKMVTFTLENLDTSYSYVNVYYSRSSAELQLNKVTKYFKIDLKYLINNNGKSIVTVTGFEPETEITASDINVTYSIINSAETLASCQNRLFLGNINKSEIPYEELSDLSLRFTPEASYENYNVKLTETYNILSKERGYIDPMYIYSKTGYWNKELYRFGIVYIMKNGELSPVFNIRGAYNLNENIKCTDIELYNKDNKRHYIAYNEETFEVINENTSENLLYENVKGVVRMDLHLDVDKIHYFKFNVNPEVIEELKKYVKGFFFVRQNRIPTILAQGITIGLDKYGRVPTIPIDGGEMFKNKLTQITNNTFVESKDLNDLNYVSEGFLTRYKWKLKQKSSLIWKKIGVIAGAVVAIAASVVASVVSFGAAAPAAGILSSAVVTAVSGFLGVSAAAAGAVIVGAAAVATTVIITSVSASIDEIQLRIHRGHLKVNGRETEIPSGYEMVDEDDSRKLGGLFLDRVIIKDSDKNTVGAILCPDFDINSATLNSLICGDSHYIENTIMLGVSKEINFDETNKTVFRYFDNKNRHFYIKEYTDTSNLNSNNLKLIGVADELKVASIGDDLYYGKAGEAEEAWHLINISDDHLKNKTDESSPDNYNWRSINSDIVRGIYSSYIAMENLQTFGPAETVNIYVPGYNPGNYLEYVRIRCNDNSPFMAISLRYNIEDIEEFRPNRTLLVGDNDGNYIFNIFRGDCYLCQYTHRFNRNFQDPAAPFSDEIIDSECWKNGYDVSDVTKYEKINISDVNAVLLGMWITFKVRSNFNLNVLTIDESNISERLMCGHPRAHYPVAPMSATGPYKISDSLIYNRGFLTSLGERYNMLVPDIPYIKQWFGTRIMYSDLQSTDAFKNGFRLFWSTNHQDYAVDYGSITKLVELNGNLLCVFEHGIALIPVNERSVAGDGAGGNVYINTNNVLPLNPNIISEKYGSQWKDSIIKTDKGIVYGVDTAAKKIWMYAGGNDVKCISDNSIQEFLNNNISLTERELTPIIGIRNVKTHYNAFKEDVMFTFYDNIYGFEEISWNLCWNELQLKWITFYSWIPSYSENIYNQYFSFNRDTSKQIAKLGISNDNNDFSDGIVLSLNIFDYNKSNSIIGLLNISNRSLPQGDDVTYNITYTLERDVWGNHNKFKIYWIEVDPENGIVEENKYIDKPNNSDKIYKQYLVFTGSKKDILFELYKLVYKYKEGEEEKEFILDDPFNYKDLTKLGRTQYDIYTNESTTTYKIDGIKLMLDTTNMHNYKVIYLNIKANIEIDQPGDKSLAEAYIDGFNNRIKSNSGYYQSTIAVIPQQHMQFLTTDFWKHGLSGIIDIKDPIKPCYWYGEQHPFEFEFVVADKSLYHKIFNNLEIISNNAEPESFHYEIIGDVYDFAKDKKNMYIRQEATKELYQYNGSDITFDHDYDTIEEDKKEISTIDPNVYVKSAILPLYYNRLDRINEIKDDYISYNDVLHRYEKNLNNSKDYDALSGGEIVRYKTLDEYYILNHAKAVNINSSDIEGGNMNYKEDKWYVQINPLNVVYHNEKISDYENDKIPIQMTDFYPPKEILNKEVDFPEGKRRGISDWGDLENQNEEVRLKDKFIKIRIRYKGNKLAIIMMINTLYAISYS